MPDLVRPSNAGADEVAVAHQRVGAYGVLLRGNRTRILMTRIAQKDYGAGLWTLPGGGLDHGEDPIDAVVREFREETSLRIIPGPIRLINSAHFLGRNRAGVLEDFHGLSIIYDVHPQPGSDLDALTILEANSSTDHVEWLDATAIYDRSTDTFDRGYSAAARAAIRSLGTSTNT
ncbi:MAG: NUDIX domain-containing protein [Antricoccus sp.]